MRRNVGGHADGDAGRTVDEQVGEPARQDARLLEPVVEVGREVDGVLVDVREQLDRHLGEPRLGVAIGSGAVPVDRAEVALPIDERIAQREVLHHAHERVVHAAVAVRVVLAEHVTHHRRGLLVRATRQQTELVHRVQHAAMHGLEAIAHVRQGTGDDDAHRVVDERLLDLLVDETRQDAFAGVWSGHGAAGNGSDTGPDAGHGATGHQPWKNTRALPSITGATKARREALNRLRALILGGDSPPRTGTKKQKLPAGGGEFVS